MFKCNECNKSSNGKENLIASSDGRWFRVCDECYNKDRI